MNKKNRSILFYCLFALLASAALLVAARFKAGFAEGYARNIFPFFPYTIGRLFSPLPFSVAELLLAALAVGLGALFVYNIVMMIKGPAARAKLRRFWRALEPRLAVFCCSLLLIYTLTCGINYSRASVAVTLGLQPRPCSQQDLRLLVFLLSEETSQAAMEIHTDSEGYFSLPKDPREPARAAMRRVGGAYEPLYAFYPRPKPVVFSLGLSYLNIAGIYSPFTVEANYNRLMPPSDIPFSICHELAHLGGYAREDEANFIAFFACRVSGDSDFVYSSLLNALTYVLNALYTEIPPAQYRELYQELPAQAQRDLQNNADYWHNFRGPAAELSRSVNDMYLKANNQPEGVKSYGRMVDLLAAYYIRD